MNMLIVDDDKVVRDVLAKMAETTRCKKVDLATSGEEALGFAVQAAQALTNGEFKILEEGIVWRRKMGQRDRT